MKITLRELGIVNCGVAFFFLLYVVTNFHTNFNHVKLFMNLANKFQNINMLKKCGSKTLYAQMIFNCHNRLKRNEESRLLSEKQEKDCFSLTSPKQKFEPTLQNDCFSCEGCSLSLVSTERCNWEITVGFVHVNSLFMFVIIYLRLSAWSETKHI